MKDEFEFSRQASALLDQLPEFSAADGPSSAGALQAISEQLGALVEEVRGLRACLDRRDVGYANLSMSPTRN